MKQRRFQPLQVGLVITAVIVMTVTAVSLRYLGRYSPFADLIRQSEQIPDIALDVKDATVVGRRQGRRRWQLHAREITFSRDHRAILATGIDGGHLFDSSGASLMIFSAGQASYLTPLGEMIPDRYASLVLTGGIHLAGSGPSAPSITAQSVTWNASRNLASAPGDVVIDFPNRAGRAVCRNIKIDTRTGNITIDRVHGSIFASKLVK